MEWLSNGAIPNYSLPLKSWTRLSIPGKPISILFPGGGYYYEKPKKISRIKEEREIMEIIQIIFKSGVLN